jgi:RING-type zinc-finger
VSLTFNQADSDDDELQRAIEESLLVTTAQEEVTTAQEEEVEEEIQNPTHFPMPSKRTNWTQILQTARQRGTDSCPICLQAIRVPAAFVTRLRKPLLLLDCSHVYHESCLQSFQRCGRVDCPECRSEYNSKVLM